MEEVLIMGVSKTTGKVVAPKNVMEAYDRDDLELWIACWDEEMQKLSKLEHISHGHTKEDLLREGITAPPISTRMISDAKYKGHVFDKRKGRMIVQGFKQIKNVHYDGKVFTPAPSQYTQKILMALVAGKNLKIKSWDISQAYTHGERVKPIALSYPVGYKKRGKNGEELFMIARKQHYGEKGAGRGWGITRTKEIKKMYNTEKFSCHVCSSDPCLNVIVRWGKEGKPNGYKMDGFEVEKSQGGECLNPTNQPSSPKSRSAHPKNIKEAPPRGAIKMSPEKIGFDNPGSSSSRFSWKNYEKDEGPTPDGNSLPLPSYAQVKEVERLGGVVNYMSVYADDIDCVGPDEGVLKEIYDTMCGVWESREVDSSFMLGVKRDFYKDSKGVNCVRMSQPDFLENAFEVEFEMYANPYLSERKKFPTVPITPGTFLSKGDAGKDAEEQKAVQEMGYQKLCGILIWACRGTFPECSFAVSQLCKLMSCPSYKCFDRGIQLLAYMYSVRKRGIVFRGDGNPEPIIMCDASFKVDPYTGKTQYGIHVLLYGGPIVVVSKKIPHVSLSTPHAELCAMNYAARTAAWLSNIFTELGLPFLERLLLLGDNTVAILNASEDIVSEKNKYIQLSYYYIREREEHLEIHHMRTDKLIPDIHTKAVPPNTLAKLIGYATGTAEEPFTFLRPKEFA